MTGRAVFPQVHVEAVVFFTHTQFFNTGLQNVVVILTLAAADDLADTGNQAVHSGNGFAVGIQLHVESLNFLGIVGDENGTLENLFRQETLMLGLQVAAPVDRVLKLCVMLLQNLHGIGIGNVTKIGVQHMVQPLQQTLIDKGVEEVHFLRSMLQNVGDDVLDHILGQMHIVFQISKGDFRFDHPEFSGVPGGVGILCPEGGAKGVDVTESHGIGFTVQLAGNRQIGGLAKEILAEVHLAILGFGNVVQVQGGHLEHFTGALTVGTGNEGRMDIDEIPLLEELVDGICSQGPYTKYSLEHIGTGTQMGHGAQKFHRVALFLHGIVAGGGTLNGYLGRLNFKGLLGIGGQQDFTLDDQSGTHVYFGNFLEIFHGVMIDHLDGSKKSAVIHNDEAKLLAGANRAHPAADGDFAA